MDCVRYINSEWTPWMKINYTRTRNLWHSKLSAFENQDCTVKYEPDPCGCLPDPHGWIWEVNTASQKTSSWKMKNMIDRSEEKCQDWAQDWFPSLRLNNDLWIRTWEQESSVLLCWIRRACSVLGCMQVMLGARKRSSGAAYSQPAQIHSGSRVLILSGRTSLPTMVTPQNTNPSCHLVVPIVACILILLYSPLAWPKSILLLSPSKTLLVCPLEYSLPTKQTLLSSVSFLSHPSTSCLNWNEDLTCECTPWPIAKCLRWRLCIQPSLRHCTDQHLPWSHCTHNPSSSSSTGNIPSAEVHPIQLSYPLISNHWCHPWLFHARICGLILGSVLIVWVNTMPIWDTVLTVLWHFKLTALSHPLPGLHLSLIITPTYPPLKSYIPKLIVCHHLSYSAASLSYVFYACSLASLWILFVSTKNV